MPHPLVIAYHLVWTTYGSWLPNDPRGSGSHSVHSDALRELGELHYGRKKVQPPGREVRQFYQKAVELLQHPVLNFDEARRTLIGGAFREVIDREHYT